MVSMSGYEARGPGSIPRRAPFFSVLFFFLFYPFNNKLLHILVKWHHQNDQNSHFLTFYIDLRMKPMGMRLNLALLKENEFGDPRFLFFFLKGNIIVHEIKINS